MKHPHPDCVDPDQLRRDAVSLLALADRTYQRFAFVDACRGKAPGHPIVLEQARHCHRDVGALTAHVLTTSQTMLHGELGRHLVAQGLHDLAAAPIRGRDVWRQVRSDEAFRAVMREAAMSERLLELVERTLDERDPTVAFRDHGAVVTSAGATVEVELGGGTRLPSVLDLLGPSWQRGAVRGTFHELTRMLAALAEADAARLVRELEDVDAVATSGELLAIVVVLIIVGVIVFAVAVVFAALCFNRGGGAECVWALVMALLVLLGLTGAANDQIRRDHEIQLQRGDDEATLPP